MNLSFMNRYMLSRNLNRYLFLFLALLVVQPSQAAEATLDERILLIWADPYVGPWEQNFTRIILRDSASNMGVPVIPEFLSLLKVDRDQEAVIAQSMQQKYGDTTIKLVIAVLPEANSFVYRWQSMFAPGAEVVYVLPGDDVRGDILAGEAGKLLDTTANEATTNTLELISTLRPDTEHLVVVTGAGSGDMSYLERFRSIIEESHLDFSATYLSGLPPVELLAAVADAPENSALLFGTFNVDRAGQLYQTTEISGLLGRESTLPLFGIFDAIIVEGAVGGNVSASTDYAEKTLEMVNALLVGESVPLLSTSATQYMFDGQQLDRFGIRRNQLPSGSTIINDSVNIFRDYSLELSAVVVVIVLQLLLIASLLRARARSRVAEKGLQQAQKLDALGSLAGGVAHDFNNILMAIVGNAEIVNLNVNDPSIVNKLTDNILAAADRAKRLVTQILMFGRSNMEEEKNSIDLKGLVAEVASQLRASSAETLKVEVSCDPELWKIAANATQIHQMLLNLCINADYAMDSRGTISINAWNKHVVKRTKLWDASIPVGDYVAVSISDTGTGMKSEDIARVFEPFFTTKPYGEGSGLGMALVHRVVKIHDGYIDLKSELGQGTTVTIYLIASQGAAVAISTEDTKSSTLGTGELILLVDDDELIVELSDRMLSHLGYRVEVYTSPVEALQQFTADPSKYDLMITDLTMPDIDGSQLIFEIRQLRSDLPIILRTGYSDAIDGRELLDLEKFILLSKPCSIAETSSAVVEVLAM